MQLGISYTRNRRKNLRFRTRTLPGVRFMKHMAQACFKYSEVHWMSVTHLQLWKSMSCKCAEATEKLESTTKFNMVNLYSSGTWFWSLLASSVAFAWIPVLNFTDLLIELPSVQNEESSFQSEEIWFGYCCDWTWFLSDIIHFILPHILPLACYSLFNTK